MFIGFNSFPTLIKAFTNTNVEKSFGLENRPLIWNFTALSVTGGCLETFALKRYSTACFINLIQIALIL